MYGMSVFVRLSVSQDYCMGSCLSLMYTEMCLHRSRCSKLTTVNQYYDALTLFVVSRTICFYLPYPVLLIAPADNNTFCDFMIFLSVLINFTCVECIHPVLVE